MTILEHFIKTESLRIRVLVPLMCALLLLLGSMALILQQSQQKVLGEELATKTREAERLFLEYREEEAQQLSLALDTLTLNKELMSAFKARDGKRLHDMTKSYFEGLRLNYDITHLYFSGPDRVNILRLHQPERYGDSIDRFTTLKAEKTGREAQGVELGPLGTLTLRVVRPWYDGERLFGYVELGMEMGHIIGELQAILDSKVYVFIDKDFIQREGWEAGIRMLGHKEEWGHFPDTVIAGAPLDRIPEKTAQFIAAKQRMQPATDLGINGTYYRVAFIPLIDAGQREIGHMAILLDTTARVAAFHRSVLVIGGFYVLVGAALFVFFYVFLGQLEKKQKGMEESRLEFEQGFRHIFDNANDGILLADIETRKFHLGNKMICSMLGYGTEEIKTLGVSDLHPEKDLPHVIDQFERQQRREIAIAENLPMQRKDGTVFYADISASPVTLGEKSYLVGIFRDITERKRVEEEIDRYHFELESMNAELKTLHEVSKAISRTLDMDELVNEVLQALVRTKIFPFELRGGIFLVDDGKMRLASFENIPEALLKPCQEICRRQCLCGQAVTTGEILIYSDTGENGLHALCHPKTERYGRIIVPLKTSNTVVGLLSLYTEPGTKVSEKLLQLLSTLGSQIGIALNNARLYEQTKSSSLHDPLTGLANRRFLQVQLEKSFEAAKRYQETLSVIMLDIDHFKNYNDTRGHLEGDRLLARLAEILLTELRDADYVFRYGGEEFLCMLPETDLTMACEVAERLRMAAEEETDVTISLGVASFTNDMPDKESLVRKADEALFKAKWNGRNRVERSVE